MNKAEASSSLQIRPKLSALDSSDQHKSEKIGGTDCLAAAWADLPELQSGFLGGSRGNSVAGPGVEKNSKRGVLGLV